MRVLVVGAGATGGYFGGRLLEKGEDITFLVRPKRKAQLDQDGLVIHSIHGDLTLPVKTIIQGQPADPFDLVILATKAYHLEETLSNLDPYVGENTTILPLLNGIRHFEILKQRYDTGKIMGGLCFIESTLTSSGHINQYSKGHNFIFGEFDGHSIHRSEAINQLFSGAKFTFSHSKSINLEIWKKYIFISTMSGMTSLVRGSIGTLWNTPNGEEIYKRLLKEIISIAHSQEPSIQPEEVYLSSLQLAQKLPHSMKSSMSRDIEKGFPIETEHFHGHLLKIKPKHLDTPVLETIYTALSAYQPTS